MSKINLHLDINEIRNRIDLDRAYYKPAAWAKFIGVSKNIVTNIHGKTNQKPSMEYIIAVSKATGKPIEWYLYGNEAITVPMQLAVGQNTPTDDFNSWPEEIQFACRLLREIMLSNHPVIKPALQSNLAAYRYSLDKEVSQDEEIRNLSRRLKLLEQQHMAGHDTGTDEAASSSTGRRKT